jgi:hypothetical protein
MKALPVSIVMVALLTSSAAAAKGKQAKQAASPLNEALVQIAATANAQGPKPADHFKPKKSNGQGAAHANLGAILRVCSKDTPAAHRAAICAEGVSPD